MIHMKYQVLFSLSSFARPRRAIGRAPDSLSQGSCVRYPVWPHTFISPSAFSRRAVVSYWRKYVHKVLVNRLGGLSLPRKSVVRFTDCPDITLDVYPGRKTTIQQQQQLSHYLTLKAPNKKLQQTTVSFFTFIF